MKKVALMSLLVAVVWGGMALVVRRLMPDDPPEPARARVVDETAPTQVLRDQLLRSTWAEVGVRPRDGVWGVLMELGFAKGVATVVALGDGTASLYLSTGGSALGGHGNQKARQAAIKLCETAATLKQETTATTSFPRPGAGQTRFYLLTDAGVRTAQADETSLHAGKHRLAPLYDGGQAVIAGLREASGLPAP